MGSIRVRKGTGKIFLDFKYQGVRCREYTLLDDTVSNRRRLQLVMAKIEREISLGIFNYSERFPESPKAKFFNKEAEQLSGIPMFSEFTNEWLQENEFRWKRSGKINMHSILNQHLLPKFGEKFINDIKKGDVLKFRAYLAQLPGRKGKTLSPKRVNNILQPLAAILNEAADRFDFISPFKTIKPLKGVRPDIRPFTLMEVQRIIQHVRLDYRVYFIVRFFTGMRSGEIHALRWVNVDFDRKIIKVMESLTYGEVDTPKTASSNRDIHMNPVVYQALLEHKELYSDNKHVFFNSKGEPLDGANITERIWYPLLVELDLDPRRPYQTRHTAASLWLASGESPEWVAQQLGHTSTQMLFNVYSRYIPNATRHDGSAFEHLLDQSFDLDLEDQS